MALLKLYKRHLKTFEVLGTNRKTEIVGFALEMGSAGIVQLMFDAWSATCAVNTAGIEKGARTSGIEPGAPPLSGNTLPLAN